MNESNVPARREDIISALFANMVIQQTNMAMMFLGLVPHPETGEQMQDLETAKMFIDQLEMIEAKTKGNLDKREEGLLQQSLTHLRMAFFEIVEGRGQAVPAEPSALAAEAPAPALALAPALAPAAAPAPAPAAEPAPVPDDFDSRKKFSKKY